MDASISLKGEILIVDDNPNNLRVLSNILNECGYQVRKALDGNMALKSIASRAPDLVLLDIRMPGFNGYEVCQKLKSHAATRHIPIIFLSALDEALDKVAAFEAGGADYICKPFQIQEVLVRVENQIALQRQRQLLENQKRQLEEQNRLLQREISERQRAEAKLQETNRKLQLLATLDELTQVTNRRYFDAYLHRHCLDLQISSLPCLALVLCEVDDFQLYSDAYGHQAADECLKAIARILRDAVAAAEAAGQALAARYGGKAFALVLPHRDRPYALEIARQIQQEIGALAIPHARSPIGAGEKFPKENYVTVSFGVTVATPAPDVAENHILRAANLALQNAKDRGRNCIAYQAVFRSAPPLKDKNHNEQNGDSIQGQRSRHVPSNQPPSEPTQRRNSHR